MGTGTLDPAERLGRYCTPILPLGRTWVCSYAPGTCQRVEWAGTARLQICCPDTKLQTDGQTDSGGSVQTQLTQWCLQFRNLQCFISFWRILKIVVTI